MDILLTYIYLYVPAYISISRHLIPQKHVYCSREAWYWGAKISDIVLFFSARLENKKTWTPHFNSAFWSHWLSTLHLLNTQEDLEKSLLRASQDQKQLNPSLKLGDLQVKFPSSPFLSRIPLLWASFSSLLICLFNFWGRLLFLRI